MAIFAVFAQDVFWGTWAADAAEDACQTAANEVGTEGNAEGLAAHEVTEGEAQALQEWAECAFIDECPVSFSA